MFWRGCLLFAALVLALSGSSAHAQDEECSTFNSCELCANRSTCAWMHCQNESAAGCFQSNDNTSLTTEKNCTRVSCGDLSTATPAITANTTSPNSTSTAATTTVKPSTAAPTHNATTTTTNTTGSTTPTAPPTPHKKATFDAASFIGGIVLVLGLQAVFFFLYKFCKSKDRNYHTL